MSNPIILHVREGDFKVRHILNTHGHADHVVANEALTCVLGVPACIHEADRDFFSRISFLINEMRVACRRLYVGC